MPTPRQPRPPHIAAQRDVLQLRRPLPVEPAITGSYPTIEVRPFRARPADEQAWIDLQQPRLRRAPGPGRFTLDASTT